MASLARRAHELVSRTRFARSSLICRTETTGAGEGESHKRESDSLIIFSWEGEAGGGLEFRLNWRNIACIISSGASRIRPLPLLAVAHLVIGHGCTNLDRPGDW
jgi:hypothetical protein